MYPSVAAATDVRSTPSRGILRVWTSRMRSRAVSSGLPTSTSLSNLPGLRRAGSIMSGRLVAPMTVTLRIPSTPSMDVRSWATTRSHAEPSPIPRTGAIESSSSKNIMQGAICLALLNI